MGSFKTGLRSTDAEPATREWTMPEAARWKDKDRRLQSPTDVLAGFKLTRLQLVVTIDDIL